MITLYVTMWQPGVAMKTDIGEQSSKISDCSVLISYFVKI